MSEPNERELIIKLALECTGYDRTKRFARLISQAQTGREAIELARIFETAIREEIEARLAPAPAQAREDEALDRYASGLCSILAAEVSPNVAGMNAWIERFRPHIDRYFAALRSRQSPQAAEELYDLALHAFTDCPRSHDGDIQHLVAMGKQLGIKPAYERHTAAAPQPSLQGEDAIQREINGCSMDVIDYVNALRARLASAQSSAQGEEARDGADAICRERERQKSVEGWTPEHDDEHAGGELAEAGAAYAIGRADLFPKAWSIIWWKVPRKVDGTIDRKRELEKAGALIAAEWDRLDRLEARAALERKEGK